MQTTSVQTTRVRTTESLRRAGRLAGIAVIGMGAAALALGSPAAAAPDPCAASRIARTVGSVATNTGIYLDANPEANMTLTAIARQPAGPQSLAAVKTYFDANPDVAADMQRLQRPLASLSGRCQLPITLPQLLGLVQAAQSQVEAPAQAPIETPVQALG